MITVKHRRKTRLEGGRFRSGRGLRKVGVEGDGRIPPWVVLNGNLSDQLLLLERRRFLTSVCQIGLARELSWAGLIVINCLSVIAANSAVSISAVIGVARSHAVSP